MWVQKEPVQETDYRETGHTHHSKPAHQTEPLQQPIPTLRGPTVAVFDLASLTPHVTAVVPSELCAGLDAADGEGDPGKARIMGVHKDILNKHAGFTRVLWRGGTLKISGTCGTKKTRKIKVVDQGSGEKSDVLDSFMYFLLLLLFIIKICCFITVDVRQFIV